MRMDLGEGGGEVGVLERSYGWETIIRIIFMYFMYFHYMTDYEVFKCYGTTIKCKMAYSKVSYKVTVILNGALPLKP